MTQSDASKLRRFWMVWNQNSRAPTYKHPSRASAETEAARLARENPGHHFLVLKAVGGKIATITPPVTIKITSAKADSNDRAS